MNTAFALAILSALQPAAPARAHEPAASAAVKVVAFDGIPDDERRSVEVDYWSDAPPPTRDHAAARGAVVRHIDNFVTVLAQQSHPQETLQGVITAVDERRDRITVRIDGASEANFKVRDGLIFNAVHDGDRVEVTVENIAGAKTIVGLKKL